MAEGEVGCLNDKLKIELSKKGNLARNNFTKMGLFLWDVKVSIYYINQGRMAHFRDFRVELC